MNSQSATKTRLASPVGLHFVEIGAARFATAHLAAVTPIIGFPETLTGSILDFSNQGMKLKLKTSLPAGAPLKIEVLSSLILAEVRYCIPDDDGSFLVEIKIDQILNNVSEVARMWRKARICSE